MTRCDAPGSTPGLGWRILIPRSNPLRKQKRSRLLLAAAPKTKKAEPAGLQPLPLWGGRFVARLPLAAFATLGALFGSALFAHALFGSALFGHALGGLLGGGLGLGGRLSGLLLSTAASAGNSHQTNSKKSITKDTHSLHSLRFVFVSPTGDD